ncbi:MAG TPA: hypothetical protein VFM34_12770 [Moraxellaceae bacterium]|nr:hypothetical protein [Moraxellaceae bacterium]
MTPTEVFNPYGFGYGNNVSVSSTSASITLADNVAKESPNILVSNELSETVFLRWGSGTQTAVTTDVPVAAGTTQVFFKGNAQVIAVVSTTGTGTVRIYPGKGI